LLVMKSTQKDSGPLRVAKLAKADADMTVS